MASFVLRIAQQEAMFKLNWTIVDADGSIASTAYLVDAGLLHQAAVSVRQQLRVIAFTTKPFEKGEFANLLRKLAQRGKELFLQLMDSAGEPEIKQRFEQVSQGSSTTRHELKVILETDRLFVPWGFVYPGRTSDLPGENKIELSLADMAGFWLSNFNISITFSRTRTLPRQRKSNACKLFALHKGMFNQAQKLLKVVDPECSDRLEKLLDGNRTPTTDWNNFRKAWEAVGNEEDSVLYFYGHSNGQRIELRDKMVGEIAEEDDPEFDLTAAGLIELKKEEPGNSIAIFLFNGCRTASPNSDSNEVPISANFLKASCDRGYYGFIGTETEVSNVFACRYGTEFLWRLFQEKRSVGETFDELLLAEKLFPQNLLYSCYADRGFRFASSTTSEMRP